MQDKLTQAIQEPFGTQFADLMARMSYRKGRWSDPRIVAYGPIEMNPASHVLHYSSSCFEGLKVHRWADGSIHFFRLDAHLKRLERSAAALCLPFPGISQCEELIRRLVKKCKEWVPKAPGSLYVRPVLMGVEPSIGAAAVPPAEVEFFVILAPVGDYFRGGIRPLRIFVEEERWRTAPALGRVKTGGNYAAALGAIQAAKEQYQIDQVLFAPNGDIQETGAANFLLISDCEVLTKPLDDCFLHGITRDSILTMARDLGYQVTERDLHVTELRPWAQKHEAALSGTAAVLSGIGTFIFGPGDEVPVGGGGVGPNTVKLRQALLSLQRGETADPFGWLTRAD